MSQSDNQSATHVGPLHGQVTEDGNLSEVWWEKNHWKRNKTKKKRVSKCTALKSDPPALRTGNDKFRISFSHVQRSLSNRKPAERKKKKKNHSDCIQLGSQLTRCATSSQLRLQKCSVGGTTTDLEYPNTQYNDWGRPSVGHLDNCRDRPERFWGLQIENSFLLGPFHLCFFFRLIQLSVHIYRFWGLVVFMEFKSW